MRLYSQLSKETKNERYDLTFSEEQGIMQFVKVTVWSMRSISRVNVVIPPKKLCHTGTL